MTTERRRIGADALRAVGGGVTSLGGAGSLVVIAIEHGNVAVGVVVFLAMQVWGICELAMRWRLATRVIRVVERLVMAAENDPSDDDLRTLLRDAPRALRDASGWVFGQPAPENVAGPVHDRPEEPGPGRVNPPDVADASAAPPPTTGWVRLWRRGRKRRR